VAAVEGGTQSRPGKPRRGLVILGITVAITVAVLALGLGAGLLYGRSNGPAAPVLADLPRPLIFAHRGGAAEGPESTVPTMLAAVAHNPQVVIELDVRASRDGEIVVIHDGSVDRTTNGKGRISDFTLAELQALDAAYCATPGQDRGTARFAVCRDPARAGDFPLRGKGYRIPTIAEVLAALPSRTALGIEVKEHGFEAALASELRRSGRLDRIVIGSSSDEVAHALRGLLPEVPLYFPRWAGLRWALSAKLTGGRIARPAYQILALPRAVPLLSLDGPGMVDAARRRGLMLAYFIIDDEPEMERLFRLGADAIMTDYPSRALAVRTRLGKVGHSGAGVIDSTSR
jgi:glycerophosphoryl diester phosphodiesterase